MVRGAVLVRGSVLDGGAGPERSGTAWAAAVAIVFAAIAFASFAVDLSLRVCPPGAETPHLGVRLR
jgi:hypothetical protein